MPGAQEPTKEHCGWTERSYPEREAMCIAGDRIGGVGSLVLLNPRDSIVMVIPDAEWELRGVGGLVPTLPSLSFFGFVFLWECLLCITVY